MAQTEKGHGNAVNVVI